MLKPRDKAEEAVQRQLRSLEKDLSTYRKAVGAIIEDLNRQYVSVHLEF